MDFLYDRQELVVKIVAPNEAWIRRWLKIAWNTEYLLSVALATKDAALLRISNQCWKGKNSTEAQGAPSCREMSARIAVSVPGYAEPIIS